MSPRRLLGIRHLAHGGRSFPVLLYRNDCGSVAAQCVLEPCETPIVDAPTPDEALDLVADALEGLLFARWGQGR